ncbi:MAG: tRNA (adenosine(37)-N6)-dimethylallyltransferase MiaA [Muribaculum sp.]|nr:tRNA (adenosine(37)-N6)-dimethylallyltransferase MiaA [Muribaculum sp.]
MSTKLLTERELIVITGPTASGKSALAIEMAQRLDTEIISADSRQIYRDIPIATAQPSAADLALVRHHLIGSHPLEAYFSASEFEQTALRICGELWRQGRTPIVCGGSMMYVDALCYGLDDIPTVSQRVRSELQALHLRLGDEWLLSELRTLDPEYYERVDRRNLKRVFHAVEISMEAGAPYSSFLTGTRRDRPFKIRRHEINLDRQELFARINSRVVTMVESGLVEEVKRVAHKRHLNSMNTVGVKEILDHLDGKMSLEEAIARIQKNTRVFAKKQLTWLKKSGLGHSET